jgi:hypothetical protein
MSALRLRDAREQALRVEAKSFESEVAKGIVKLLSVPFPLMLEPMPVEPRVPAASGFLLKNPLKVRVAVRRG